MANTSKNYLQMSRELDDILVWFETDDVDLDQAVTKYQQATLLIEQMENYLKTVQNKIQKIAVGKVKP